MKNSEVVTEWIKGESAKSGNGNLHTDGLKIFSYRLCIGFTTPLGVKVCHEFAGKNMVSMTTSCHVGRVRGVANRISTDEERAKARKEWNS
jgi:hypothetical protein